MSAVHGPYETERDAAAGPAATQARATATGRATAATLEYHLLAACEDAGVTLGAHDRRVLAWLAGWEPSTVQVVAGIIGRANREAGIGMRPAGRE